MKNNTIHYFYDGRQGDNAGKTEPRTLSRAGNSRGRMGKAPGNSF